MATILWVLLLIGTTISAQWDPVASPTDKNLSALFFPGENIGYAVGEDGVVIKTQDGGLHWELIPMPVIQHLNGLHFFDDSSGMVVGDSGVILTTHDGGATWVAEFHDSRCFFRDIHFTSEGRGFVGGVFRGERKVDVCLYQTPGQGEAWSYYDFADSIRSQISAPAIRSFCFATPEIGYTAGSGVIFKTEDGGVTWRLKKEARRDPDFPATFFFDCCFLDEKIGFFTGRYYGSTVKSTDGAKSLIHDNLTSSHGVWFQNSSMGFTAGAYGVYRTDDGGVSWKQEWGDRVVVNLNDIAFTKIGRGFVVGEKGRIMTRLSPNAGAI